ncbi:MAG: EF-P beta-lysylation protein EpmB [Pseudomonadota bacterium]
MIPRPLPTQVAITSSHEHAGIKPDRRPDWRTQLKQGWRTPEALLAHLQLSSDQVDASTDTPFPMRVPKAFSARMQAGNPADPLLRQVLPIQQEMSEVEGFVSDPVGDGHSRSTRGLLHKYRGRVLLIASGACAIHCRYCFRREFPYASEHAGPAHWHDALDYIAKQRDVEEVILSGGDPWMLGTDRLQALTDAPKPIAHLKRLRIHTRMPITLPDRVDADLLSWLDGLPFHTVVVVHANHANEFDSTVAQAITLLKQTNVTVFNQAVLLAGVNDSLNDLSALMRTSFDAGAIPYYLHLLDRVRGSAHFEVSEPRALTLMQQLRTSLSGYLVPRLVREQAGAAYKLPVF